jgi:hypothetical protein
MNKLDQFRIASRIVALDPGLHIFRYATQLLDGEIVQLTLQPTPVGKGQVDFFPAEGVTRNTLARLGDCLIARVKSAAAGILITEYRSPGAVSAVDLRLDRIDTSADIIREAAADPGHVDDVTQGPALQANLYRLEALSMTGIVQYQGAVSARSDTADAWLGNPDGPEALEGFAISWDTQPPGVELIYTCSVHGLGQLPATRAGTYIGTRDRHLPIQTVSFLLAGPRAGAYELSGEVAFSGHPPLALRPGVALAGPTGLEPLVALRPRIVAKPSPDAVRSPGLADPSDRLAAQLLPAWDDQAIPKY